MWGPPTKRDTRYLPHGSVGRRWGPAEDRGGGASTARRNHLLLATPAVSLEWPEDPPCLCQVGQSRRPHSSREMEVRATSPGGGWPYRGLLQAPPTSSTTDELPITSQHYLLPHGSVGRRWGPAEDRGGGASTARRNHLLLATPAVGLEWPEDPPCLCQVGQSRRPHSSREMGVRATSPGGGWPYRGLLQAPPMSPTTD